MVGKRLNECRRHGLSVVTVRTETANAWSFRMADPHPELSWFQDLVDDLGQVRLDRVQVHGVLQLGRERGDGLPGVIAGPVEPAVHRPLHRAQASVIHRISRHWRMGWPQIMIAHGYPRRRVVEYRELGRSRLHVSEIGYGAWGIGGAGWVGAEDDESLRALHRAIELGVNFIDTARGYGESERIVGQAVREHPGHELHVATKVPPRNGIWPAPGGLHPDETFPGAHIRTSLETSLAATGLEAIDVLQFHVWSDDWVGGGDWLETVASLKQEGKIRFFGISINDYQPEN